MYTLEQRVYSALQKYELRSVSNLRVRGARAVGNGVGRGKREGEIGRKGLMAIGFVKKERGLWEAILLIYYIK